MAKDATQTVAAGLHANFWLAPVGEAPPATFATAFAGNWFNLGYLDDPPDPNKAVSSNDIIPWNAPEAIRTILDTETNTMVLKSLQANPKTFELYFGPITIVAEGSGGVRITPNLAADQPEKIICLEVLDGTKVFRIFWARCVVSDVGSMAMPRDGVMSFELTLKRLVPVSGSSWFHQTNLAALVAASA